jgi:citronellol/citronellal dehydrogenase
VSVLAADANAGRVALVTGGGTGIGRATALALARTGARVAVCGRREELLATTCAELERLGADCLAVPADVREPEDRERALQSTLERFGPVDVLVNNEVAKRSMIPGGGGVVFFVGFSPRRGMPGMAHAAAARAALENLAGSLSSEWGRYGVRAVCIAPGTILTEGLEQYGPERIAEWERAVPLGRLGRPEDVADVIAFLASEGGAYVSGTTIVVDGGSDAWGLAGYPPAGR